MSSSASPQPYNELEDAFLNDAQFKVDISQKMKVPSKISFNTDSNTQMLNHFNENINMHVPERILVVGQNQHIGTRAPPREIAFDNSLLQSEPYPGDIRVATPPRTLTLDRYPFPGISSDAPEKEEERLPVVKKNSKFTLNDTDLNMSLSHRESPPPIGASGEGLTVSEEVLHLRRQMAKLNRRVMALEMEHLNYLQREKFLYGFGIAYFLLKAIFWLNRS